MGTSKNRKSLFEFKQFSVSDATNSMKIGTDGVLLGAWCSISDHTTAWDVGTGTGLIALMIAQRGASRIKAIEINEAAYREACLNVASSPWSGRVEVVHGDINEIAWTNDCTPDLIVSNPPFFNEALMSPDIDRRSVRHEQQLSFRQLFDIASKKLSPDGTLSVVAPASRFEELKFESALAGLAISRATFVRTVETKNPKRVLIEFVRSSSMRHQTSAGFLTIRRSDGSLSEEYRRLVSEFYTILN